MPMQVDLSDGEFCVDAALLATLLDIPAADVQRLLRDNQIVTQYERGVDEHAGRHRLSFSYNRRHARLIVDEHGRVIQRSVVNFADR